MLEKEQFITSVKNLILWINTYYLAVVSDLKNEKNALKTEGVFIYKGIDIFLKFLSPELKRAFLSQLNPEILKYRQGFLNKNKERVTIGKIKSSVFPYLQSLAKSDSLKVFIGKDAYLLYSWYKEEFSLSGKDSLFIKYSRPYLFNESNGTDYMRLTDLIYLNAYRAKNKYNDFFSFYASGLKNDKAIYRKIFKKTVQILRKNNFFKRATEFKEITVVDSGTQGGLALPLTVVLKDEGYKADFSLYSGFSWLNSLYKNRIYTKDLFIFLRLEYESIKRYNKKNKE